VILISLFNFLLTPVHITILDKLVAEIVVVNYSIVILTSSILASNKKSKIWSYLLGIFTLTFIWLEFSYAENNTIKIFRLGSSLILFSYFFSLLIYQLKNMKGISLQFIIGPILGFLFLGIIGGVLFETIYLMDSSAFQLKNNITGYIFYYFSFISITTVGYGDVTPATSSAQAITLIMNIIGQFYLAIVIAVFVGKYNNIKS